MSIDAIGNRVAPVLLALSAAGLVSIVSFEGYTDKAIIPVKGDKPTYGFGSTGADVKLGDKTTPPKALERALRDVQKFEGAIQGCITAPLYRHEFDAFVSLAYNVGSGAFCGSTLVKKANASDYAGACGEILRWRYYQGKDCSITQYQHLCGGLWARRQAEAKHCRGEQ